MLASYNTDVPSAQELRQVHKMLYGAEQTCHLLLPASCPQWQKTHQMQSKYRQRFSLASFNKVTVDFSTPTLLSIHFRYGKPLPAVLMWPKFYGEHYGSKLIVRSQTGYRENHWLYKDIPYVRQISVYTVNGGNFVVAVKYATWQWKAFFWTVDHYSSKVCQILVVVVLNAIYIKTKTKKTPTNSTTYNQFYFFT